MKADRRARIWDEVWAEYDNRQAQRQAGQVARVAAPAGALVGAVPDLAFAGGGQAVLSFPAAQIRRPAAMAEAEAATGPAKRRVRPLAQTMLAVTAGALLVAAWLVLPWLLALRLSVPIGQSDAPGLLRQFDGPAAMASLRAGLAAEVPDGAGEGARRFLSGMADRMAASWETPEGVSSWLALRARGGRFEGSPAPISALRSARPTGLASFRLEYGPSHGEGGVAFDVAWQGDGFRVTGMHFLQAPPAPLGAGGALIALR